MQRTDKVNYTLAAAVAFLTFLVYLPALQNDFVNWDDGAYVIENPHIRSLDSSLLKWAFLDFYAANWHPLTWISHALDYAVWGLNPLGHHLTNNIFHSINTFLVVLLVVRLVEATTPTPPYQGGELLHESSPPILGGVSAGRGGKGLHNSHFTLVTAATTGLLFGLHPLHVESVAWVAERKDLLCALFYLLSVMAYSSYRSNTTYRSYILSLLFFILALLSKPMAVSLPLVLLILDRYPFRKITSLKTFLTAFFGKLPFIFLSFFSSVITILAQRSGEAIRTTEFAALSTRSLVAGKALIRYLWNMIMPLNLVPFYPYPQNISLLSIEYVLTLMLIAGLSIVSLVIAKKQEIWISAWAYYILTLLPVLGIIQVGEQAMADRYTYLPSLGPFLLVGIVAAWSLEKVEVLNRLSRGPMIFSFAAVIFVLSMSYLTVQQIGVWKNSITLWNFVIEKEPDKVPFAYYNRGLFLAKMGRYKESIEDFDRAISLVPFGHSEYYNNRGVSCMNEKLFDKAIEDLNMAIALDPNNNNARYNLGLTYYRRGSSLLIAGNKELAGSDFQKACNLGNKKGCNVLQALGS